MKVRSSVKIMCKNCKIVSRKKIIRILCFADNKHKQKQG